MKKIYYALYRLFTGRTHPEELERIFSFSPMDHINNLPFGYENIDD